MDLSNWLSAIIGGLIAAFILSGGFAIFGPGYIRELIGNRLRERADTIREQNSEFGWGNGFDPPGRFLEGLNPEDAGFNYDDDDDEDDEDDE